MKMKPTMQMSGFSSGGMMFILILLLVGAAGGMVTMFFLGAQSDRSDKTYISRLGNQRVLSQEIAKLATQAARGRVDVFKQLQTARDEFQSILDFQIQTSNPATHQEMKPLAELEGKWKSYRGNVDTILGRREVVQPCVTVSIVLTIKFRLCWHFPTKWLMP